MPLDIQDYFTSIITKGNSMKPETTVLLVKELEKIRSKRSNFSYFGAWSELCLAIIWLARLYSLAFEKAPAQTFSWFYTLMFVIPLVLLLHSFFIIVQHLMNKKFLVLFEALLEKKASDHELK
jgi:hypothetical protein